MIEGIETIFFYSSYFLMTLPFDIFFLTQIPPLLLYSGASASLGGKKHNMAIVSHAQHPKEIIFC